MRRRSAFLPLLLSIALLPSVAHAQQPSPEATGSPDAASLETPGASASPPASPRPETSPETSPEPTPEPLPKLDFKVGDWDLRKVRWKNLRYTGGGVMPVVTQGPQDAKGVPMSPLGRFDRLVYNPTVVAQQGMRRLDSYRRTGSKVHLRQARKYADLLERMSDGSQRRRWQPHRYRYGVHDAGWVNSNSHGLVLSFLSRYYKLTGSKERLEEATLLFEAYKQRPDNRRWFSDVTRKGYIWFEHWPDGVHDHTLNAHLNAMFGLYDYWLATGDPLAEQYFLGGAKTVRDKLDRFRRKGDLSRYSLGSKNASVHYHETHILQLDILAAMTGDKWFSRQADRFRRDEEKWRAQNRGQGRIGRR